MKRVFRELLHRYKVEAFKLSHGAEHEEDRTKEVVRAVEEALNNTYHFDFHQDPDKRNIETFNMIKDYTVEAILPPVLEKLVRRIVVLERQQEALVGLVEQILEKLSESDIRPDEDQVE